VIRQRAFFEQWIIDWIGSGHGGDLEGAQQCGKGE